MNPGGVADGEDPVTRTEPAVDTRPPKRNRITVACTWCRQRKSRVSSTQTAVDEVLCRRVLAVIRLIGQLTWCSVMEPGRNAPHVATTATTVYIRIQHP